MSRIKFTADSVCDIPPHLLEGTEIQLFPFPIAMGDTEYLDGVDVTPDQFYQLLLDAPSIPTHSQLTAFFFEEKFEEIWQEGYDFWLAMYSDALRYAYRVRMWQYTSSGSVPGIQGRVDLNLYFPEESR